MATIHARMHLITGEWLSGGVEIGTYWKSVVPNPHLAPKQALMCGF